ncbi:MAG: hypothetical protein KF729_03030 [Sandaracinaceae bacterium]|nr:hypothetical protein [Sandaracinaceae bacterium]
MHRSLPLASGSIVGLFALVVFGAATGVAAQSWRPVPDAVRFAAPGAPEVTLEVRRAGGGGCGGGGCTAGVAFRNVRGALPSRDLAYYYSDRPGPSPGCLPSPEGVFEDWTEIVIAPARGGAERRPSCGIGVRVGSEMRYWVILRVRGVATP